VASKDRFTDIDTRWPVVSVGPVATCTNVVVAQPQFGWSGAVSGRGTGHWHGPLNKYLEDRATGHVAAIGLTLIALLQRCVIRRRLQ